MMILLLLTVLPVCRANQIKINPINNPILPFSLGTARITTRKHSFIKYIDLNKFERPLTEIKINLKSIVTLINTKDELYPQLNSIHNHLDYLVKQVETKLFNVKPKKTLRYKRGLINIVGKGYKWAFGLLDQDDADKYDKAISTLELNQNLIHSDLENSLTVMKQFMNESLATFNKIIDNQHAISKRLITIESNINKFTLFLHLQNHLDIMIIDCQSMINLLDNIQDSILFASLETVHSLILPVNELQNLVSMMEVYYTESLPRFKNIQSYYQLIKIEIHYVKDNICFIFHMPILRENLYDYFHLYPIPLNNQTIIPLKPYILLNSTFHHYEDNPCPVIEDTCIYHMTQQITRDDCLPNILTGKSDIPCQVIDISIEKDIIEPINDAYLIVIPANASIIEKSCKEHGFKTVQNPKLVYVPQNCSVTINNVKYENWLETISETPLELLPVQTLSFDSTAPQWTSLQPVNMDKLTDIQKLAEKTNLHKLQKLTVESATNNIGLYICVILILIVIIFLIYKYTACNKIKIIKILNSNKNNKKQEHTPADENNLNPLFSS